MARRGAERVNGANVSATLFNVLGFTPFVGRLLTPEDNLHEQPSVVVLGYDYWVRRFGGDRGIVGKTIPIEGFPMEVVGVLKAGATLPDTRIDILGARARRPGDAGAQQPHLERHRPAAHRLHGG